ncbi:MAG: ThuA domain-containing protein [Bryobacterales bacterium]|nr:ThuA domain-containing protein [Bryobacterales bacterium]MBV9401161.1 ThuA domain-containing protein [Bryobacterales bacterium]
MTSRLETRTRTRIILAFAAVLAGTFILLAQAPETAGGNIKGKSKAGPPGANHPERLQALIITGQNPHDWRGTTASLRKTLEETLKFEVRVVEEFRGGTPEMLKPYGLVIVNYYDGARPENRWGERADNALADFVRSGKGLVLYHLSLGAFDGWTDYEKMSGGNWRPNKGHHSAQHDFALDIKDPEHPITKGVKSPLRVQHDELFANLKWQPEGSFHLLATAYDDHALYNGRSTQPIPGAGADEPILWTTQFGMGRVFVTALGHDPMDTENPAFKITFARGAEWAASGQVTIPIPAEPAK